jgi:hypothetical protein
MKENGLPPDEEVLRIAQIIIDRANEQYEGRVEDSDSDHENERFGDLLDEKPTPSNSSGPIISCELGSLDGYEPEVDGNKLYPIDEDPEAEVEAESENEVSVVNGAGHSIVENDEGEETCKLYTIKCNFN